jgi:hypothetical protein
MSELRRVPLSDIDPNPMRQLDVYPFKEKKIEVLRKSIREVGLWEGVIGRVVGNRVEIAFGHHRVEAARREFDPFVQINVIIRNLTDEQMVQFMGRENLEEYNADFIIMLNSWEAGNQFLLRRAGVKPQVIEIARLLGWTIARDGGTVSSDTACACSDASKLIEGGFLSRGDLDGLSVKSAREICGRIVAQHEATEALARKTKTDIKDVERAKEHTAKAGKDVAERVKDGSVAQRNIRNEIDHGAFQRAAKDNKPTPLFAVFAEDLVRSIARLGADDGVGRKLQEVESALPRIEMQSDFDVVRRITTECHNVARRFERWERTFSDPQRKVVPLREISQLK